MAPTALALVMTMFSDGAERNKALGIWGGLGGVGATAGLLLGGVITSGLGWEWIFYINIPIGAAILLLCPLLVPESRDLVAVRRFDVAGAVTITAALMLLIYAVTQAPEAGWGSALTIALLAGSVALVVGFVVIETVSAAPLVPFRIFRSRALVGGNVVIFAAGIAWT